MRALPGLWFLILLLATTLSGCRSASRSDKISAPDDTGFELWLSDHKDVLSPVDVKELATARQQIRYKVMQTSPGMMSADFARAVNAEMEGKTLHELLLTSYALQIERMKVELQNYQPQLQRFQAHEKNRSLNAEQKQIAAEALEKLHRVMTEHEDELARLTKRLSELEHEAVAVK
ncbi:MAG: hypothetical protein ABIZ04_18800 [Opitutus sp.]